MTYVVSILLAFLAFGYVTFAAPELPYGSNLTQYPEDTPPPPNGESTYQRFMDEMEEQTQDGHLDEVREEALPNSHAGEFLQLFCISLGSLKSLPTSKTFSSFFYIFLRGGAPNSTIMHACTIL